MEEHNKKLNKLLVKAVEHFETRKAKTLLKQGADPDSVVNQKGKTVLMEAAHRCDLSMVKTLIKYGADIKSKDRKPGFNALLYACSSGCLGIIKLLQKAGEDIHSVSNDHSNGLMHAAFNNKYKILKYLINQGLNINARNDKGQSALIFGLDNCIGNYGFIRFNKAEKLRKDKKKTVIKLIEMGADVNSTDNNGNTPLNYTVNQGCTEHTELLLNKGANIESSKKNLLQTAERAAKNKDEIKVLLKKHGAIMVPFSIAYKLSIVCKECGKYVPMNGPLEKVKCDHCSSETKFSELDDNFWEYIMEDSAEEEHSTELERTFKLDLIRKNPHCSKCNTELDISDYHFGSEVPLICKKCGAENSSFPAPDFLKNYTVYDLPPKQIFCAEKEGNDRSINQDDVKPVAIKCDSCAATLSIKFDSPRNYTCEHCGTVQYLPDPIWKALHPMKKREDWYIYYA